MASIIISTDGDRVCCQSHQKETCDVCDMDWSHHNDLAATLKNTPELTPTDNTQCTITPQIARLKERGNKQFETHHYAESVQLYTQAIQLSFSRPLWQPFAFQVVREELTALLSHRSAAYFADQNYIAAYIDGEMVTRLKRDWSTGWLRKAKALFALQRTKEAETAASMGLRFAPKSDELSTLLSDIQKTL
ncbi:uncharacterized protein BYT42DRAFT_300813 [Radiomyces spectabilis]|uniref:uncharacterized protein n=1 Tax=Radiomyces spectabilis TaxID=64574 RepID=UPI00221EF481|nr:uncharacterized protein BYT42DRAFT_300813 [Radiomyces spectabilis]KAI8381308.1 hypothetical protein BYT42DRAFT_300813 [Radiomyces spectabilis]